MAVATLPQTLIIWLMGWMACENGHWDLGAPSMPRPAPIASCISSQIAATVALPLPGSGIFLIAAWSIQSLRVDALPAPQSYYCKCGPG